MARAESPRRRKGRDPERVGRLIDHLVELRTRLLRSVVAIGVGFVVGLFFYEPIWQLLQAPYVEVFDGNLLSTLPAEPFSVAMRLAGFLGVGLATPGLAWEVWGVIGPGLTTREKRWAIPIVVAMAALFVTGVVFAYSILPRALEVLGTIIEVEYTPTIGQYTTFVLRLLLVFGVTFQFPVFLFGAAAADLITREQLSKGRRWAIVIIVIVAAAATPTGDAFTLAVLAVPLYLLYEATILLVRLVLRK